MNATRYGTGASAVITKGYVLTTFTTTNRKALEANWSNVSASPFAFRMIDKLWRMIPQMEFALSSARVIIHICISTVVGKTGGKQ